MKENVPQHLIREDWSMEKRLFEIEREIERERETERRRRLNASLSEAEAGT
jgi:hypothetical protein